MSKPASKPPCFLFNVRDWLCSPSLGRMTDKQVRVYLTLLCYSWLEIPRATLPNDEGQLAQLLHLSMEEWDQIKAPILAKFNTDGNGRIFNERLMEESDYCAKKSVAGKARWAAGGKQNETRTATKRTAKK
jgi:uncharacterized protein YdaU (DUF1376 family)